MSTQITEAFVRQYGSNVFHLSQQRGSRLRPTTRMEMQRGKLKFFERVGLVSAQERTSRHADTPILNTPHSRRGVILRDFEYGDLVDDVDKIRTLISPENEYVKAAIWSLGRSMDERIINAADGSAITGEDGDGSQAHPNSQKIASVSGGAGSGLNVQALRRAKKLLDAAEVDPMEPRYCVHSAEQLEDLLGETETTSSDFNTVKALVQGEINTFLGFNFIHSELLNLQSGTLAFDVTSGAVGSGGGDADGYRKVLCYARSGIVHSVGMDIKAMVQPRADKSFSMQVYASLSNGAVRMEEEQVVVIFANEA